MRLRADELLFAASLQKFIDVARAKWEADDERRGRVPDEQTIGNRMLWEAMIEDTEWDKFYGPPANE